ncbi:hypothetical protein H0H93_014174 [Arthromyces matolae]|nr:hypothetical protein H0H93_014174 [Arthromyces matolae]
MDEDEAELRNPFPSPPSHYTSYTSHNLRLLALLKERASDQPDVNQHDVLSDQSDVPDWPLTKLEKPRIDWILEDPEPYFEVFGDRWFVKEKIPSLAELGGNQLYPADHSTDRRPALLGVLRSLLVSFSSLASSLLAPPPSTSSNDAPDWQRNVEWITVLSQNIMAAANDLRPVQARENLELMMRRQLDLRKSETKTLHSYAFRCFNSCVLLNLSSKCDALEAKLSELHKYTDNLPAKIFSTSTSDGGSIQTLTEYHDGTSLGKADIPSKTNVLQWAEEVRKERDMSTKRRIGVSIASTEAARRQLMQPVTCWEKVWVLPENGAPGSSLKIYKWVKTDKAQQFSDDEGGVDEPLVPLPDEPEVVDGDDEEEVPENGIEETQATEIVETVQDEESKPPSPKPQLSMSLQNGTDIEGDTLDTSLKPMDEDMGVELGLGDQSITGLDMSGLGPDGLGLEDTHNLAQLEGVDVLVGGQAMDDSTDPFQPVDE